MGETWQGTEVWQASPEPLAGVKTSESSKTWNVLLELSLKDEAVGSRSVTHHFHPQVLPEVGE